MNKEQVIQRDDGLIGSNHQNYRFDLGGIEDDELGVLKGEVEMDLDYVETVKLLKTVANKIVNSLNEETETRKLSLLTSAALTKARAVGDLFISEPSYDNVDLPGDSDLVHFPGEMYTGVNVVE